MAKTYGIFDRWAELSTKTQLVAMGVLVAGIFGVLALVMSADEDDPLLDRLRASTDCAYLNREFRAASALSEELSPGPQRASAREYAQAAAVRILALQCNDEAPAPSR